MLSVLLLIFAFVLPDGNILRTIFGLPFLLFLPGYSLVSALWVKKSEMDMLERTVLSLGLSIALVALLGIGLNFTPMGITLNSIVIALFILIMILVGLTWFRRKQLAPEDMFQPNFTVLNDTIDAISSRDKLVIILIAVSLVIGVVLLAYIASNPPKEKFTELFILDADGTIENYPTDIIVNENASISIVVVSHEQEKTDYNVIVWLRPENGTDETISDYNFTLDNEPEWQQDINFSINQTGKFLLEIELYKNNNVSSYANVHLWIDVSN
jgi:uncharacterized membrane protein